MPTILRHAGFEVRIYTADHPLPPVHVHKGGAVLKLPLATCLADQVVGEISDRDVRRAEEFVGDHAARLRHEWERLHGKELRGPRRSGTDRARPRRR